MVVLARIPLASILASSPASSASVRPKDGRKGVFVVLAFCSSLPGLPRVPCRSAATGRMGVSTLLEVGFPCRILGSFNGDAMNNSRPTSSSLGAIRRQPHRRTPTAPEFSGERMCHADSYATPCIGAARTHALAHLRYVMCGSAYGPVLETLVPFNTRIGAKRHKCPCEHCGLI